MSKKVKLEPLAQSPTNKSDSSPLFGSSKEKKEGKKDTSPQQEHQESASPTNNTSTFSSPPKIGATTEFRGALRKLKLSTLIEQVRHRRKTEDRHLLFPNLTEKTMQWLKATETGGKKDKKSNASSISSNLASVVIKHLAEVKSEQQKGKDKPLLAQRGAAVPISSSSVPGEVKASPSSSVPASTQFFTAKNFVNQKEIAPKELALQFQKCRQEHFCQYMEACHRFSALVPAPNLHSQFQDIVEELRSLQRLWYSNSGSSGQSSSVSIESFRDLKLKMEHIHQGMFNIGSKKGYRILACELGYLSIAVKENMELQLRKISPTTYVDLEHGLVLQFCMQSKRQSSHYITALNEVLSNPVSCFFTPCVVGLQMLGRYLLVSTMLPFTASPFNAPGMKSPVLFTSDQKLNKEDDNLNLDLIEDEEATPLKDNTNFNHGICAKPLDAPWVNFQLQLLTSLTNCSCTFPMRARGLVDTNILAASCIHEAHLQEQCLLVAGLDARPYLIDAQGLFPFIHRREFFTTPHHCEGVISRNELVALGAARNTSLGISNSSRYLTEKSLFLNVVFNTGSFQSTQSMNDVLGHQSAKHAMNLVDTSAISVARLKTMASSLDKSRLEDEDQNPSVPNATTSTSSNPQPFPPLISCLEDFNQIDKIVFLQSGNQRSKFFSKVSGLGFLAKEESVLDSVVTDLIGHIGGETQGGNASNDLIAALKNVKVSHVLHAHHLSLRHLHYLHARLEEKLVLRDEALPLALETQGRIARGGGPTSAKEEKELLDHCTSVIDERSYREIQCALQLVICETFSHAIKHLIEEAWREIFTIGNTALMVEPPVGELCIVANWIFNQIFPSSIVLDEGVVNNIPFKQRVMAESSHEQLLELIYDLFPEPNSKFSTPSVMKWDLLTINPIALAHGVCSLCGLSFKAGQFVGVNANCFKATVVSLPDSILQAKRGNHIAQLKFEMLRIRCCRSRAPYALPFVTLNMVDFYRQCHAASGVILPGETASPVSFSPLSPSSPLTGGGKTIDDVLALVEASSGVHALDGEPYNQSSVYGWILEGEVAKRKLLYWLVLMSTFFNNPDLVTGGEGMMSATKLGKNQQDVVTQFCASYNNWMENHSTVLRQYQPINFSTSSFLLAERVRLLSGVISSQKALVEQKHFASPTRSRSKNQQPSSPNFASSSPDELDASGIVASPNSSMLLSKKQSSLIPQPAGSPPRRKEAFASPLDASIVASPTSPRCTMVTATPASLLTKLVKRSEKLSHAFSHNTRELLDHLRAAGKVEKLNAAWLWLQLWDMDYMSKTILAQVAGDDLAKDGNNALHVATERKRFLEQMFGASSILAASAANEIGQAHLACNELDQAMIVFENALDALNVEAEAVNGEENNTLSNKASENSQARLALEQLITNNLGFVHFTLGNQLVPLQLKKGGGTNLLNMQQKIPKEAKSHFETAESLFRALIPFSVQTLHASDIFFQLARRKSSLRRRSVNSHSLPLNVNVDPALLGDVYNNLGSLFLMLHHYSDSRHMFIESLSVTKNIFSDQHSSRAAPIRNLKICEKRQWNRAAFFLNLWVQRKLAKKRMEVLKVQKNFVDVMQKFGRGYLCRRRLQKLSLTRHSGISYAKRKAIALIMAVGRGWKMRLKLTPAYALLVVKRSRRSAVQKKIEASAKILKMSKKSDDAEKGKEEENDPEVQQQKLTKEKEDEVPTLTAENLKPLGEKNSKVAPRRSPSQSSASTAQTKGSYKHVPRASKKVQALQQAINAAQQVPRTPSSVETGSEFGSLAEESSTPSLTGGQAPPRDTEKKRKRSPRREHKSPRGEEVTASTVKKDAPTKGSASKGETKQTEVVIQLEVNNLQALQGLGRGFLARRLLSRLLTLQLMRAKNRHRAALQRAKRFNKASGGSAALK